MIPHALNLALTTPLENLLAPPDSVGMVATLREDLAQLEHAQLQTLLVCMDDGINEVLAAELLPQLNNRPGARRLMCATSTTEK